MAQTKLKQLNLITNKIERDQMLCKFAWFHFTKDQKCELYEQWII